MLYNLGILFTLVIPLNSLFVEELKTFNLPYPILLKNVRSSSVYFFFFIHSEFFCIHSLSGTYKFLCHGNLLLPISENGSESNVGNRTRCFCFLKILSFFQSMFQRILIHLFQKIRKR